MSRLYWDFLEPPMPPQLQSTYGLHRSENRSAPSSRISDSEYFAKCSHQQTFEGQDNEQTLNCRWRTPIPLRLRHLPFFISFPFSSPFQPHPSSLEIINHQIFHLDIFSSLFHYSGFAAIIHRDYEPLGCSLIFLPPPGLVCFPLLFSDNQAIFPYPIFSIMSSSAEVDINI